MKTHSFLIGTVIAAAIFQASPVRPIYVSGESMAPTFHSNQIVFGRRDFKTLHRGDVVVFNHSSGRAVKRIAALPGDKIPRFKVKGEWMVPSTRELQKSFERYGCERDEIVVPVGHVWVLGDNPNYSEDSRNYGPVPISSIEVRIDSTDGYGGNLVPTAHLAKGTEIQVQS